MVSSDFPFCVSLVSTICCCQHMATTQQMFHVLECFHLFQAHFVLLFAHAISLSPPSSLHHLTPPQFLPSTPSSHSSSHISSTTSPIPHLPSRHSFLPTPPTTPLQTTSPPSTLSLPPFPTSRGQCPCCVSSLGRCQAGLPPPSHCCSHEEAAAGGRGT